MSLVRPSTLNPAGLIWRQLVFGVWAREGAQGSVHRNRTAHCRFFDLTSLQKVVTSFRTDRANFHILSTDWTLSRGLLQCFFIGHGGISQCPQAKSAECGLAEYCHKRLMNHDELDDMTVRQLTGLVDLPGTRLEILECGHWRVQIEQIVSVNLLVGTKGMDTKVIRLHPLGTMNVYCCDSPTDRAKNV